MSKAGPTYPPFLSVVIPYVDKDNARLMFCDIANACDIASVDKKTKLMARIWFRVAVQFFRKEASR